MQYFLIVQSVIKSWKNIVRTMTSLMIPKPKPNSVFEPKKGDTLVYSLFKKVNSMQPHVDNATWHVGRFPTDWKVVFQVFPTTDSAQLQHSV